MLQNIPLTDVDGFMLPLSSGEAFCAHVPDINPSITKTLLKEHDVFSILMLLVMVQGEFYGFLGLVLLNAQVINGI